MSSLWETQNQIDDFIRHNNMLASTESRLLDLVSEVGELSKAHLKATNYGRRKIHDDNVPFGWSEELGDVFFSLICLANVNQVNLEMALDGVLEKYKDRISKTGEPESGR